MQTPLPAPESPASARQTAGCPAGASVGAPARDYLQESAESRMAGSAGRSGVADAARSGRRLPTRRAKPMGTAATLLVPLALAQKHRQRVPGVLVRAHNAMCHFQAAKQLAIRTHKLVEPLQVLLAHRGRIDRPLGLGLKVLEHAGFSERKIRLVAVEQLKDDAFVTVKTKLLEPERHVVRWLQQIRKQQDDTAPMHQADGVLEQLGQAGAARRDQLFEMSQH